MPSYPLNLIPINSSDTWIDIEWEPPKHDGYAPITQYLIETSEFGTKNWNKTAYVAGDQNKYRLDHLNPGSAYYIRVSAINEFGQSKRAAELYEPVYAKGFIMLINDLF